jgi:hypothetical protein
VPEFSAHAAILRWFASSSAMAILRSQAKKGDVTGRSG